MKKTLKTKEILKLYNIIRNVKYGKMDDADKIKVWKIARKLKPIAAKFEEDSKDAAEKFKAGYADFDQRLQKAQEYEQAEQQNKNPAEIMRDADYNNFIKDFKEYQKLMDDALEEFAKKEVEVEFDAITEEAFCKLLASNELTVAQTVEIGDIIVE